jgi:aspartyl-tRNA(Asn)/glutamyl-tRNA(Gln) amidotransferase subunit B
MRSKEEAHDYRYFPEPGPHPGDHHGRDARARAPGAARAARAREERYRDELGLHPDAARLLAWRSELGAFYEEALRGERRTRGRWPTG